MRKAKPANESNKTATQVSIISRIEGELLEANEQLVIASLRAHARSEAWAETAEHMSHLAEHDNLTGLPNRAVFLSQFKHTVALAHRGQRNVAVMFIDLDGFKLINDTLGHDAGDQLLQSVAKRLRSSVRASDLVCRHGGDEFIVLLSELESPADAASVAQKVVETMAFPHFTTGGVQMEVTLSVGVSVYPHDGTDIENLIKSADAAMYQAKRGGGNNYCLFNEDLNAREIRHKAVKLALSRALDLNELKLHYQAKVNLTTFKITGVEVLLRWQRPNEASIAAGELIAVADASGLIVPIGKWVLAKACSQAAAWIAADFGIERVSVNVSSSEFYHIGFLAAVSRALKVSGLDPSRLELELTERTLLEKPKSALASLLALKKFGVRIALDDFGTGYSSLNCIGQFPIDTLKIDGVVTQGLGGETARRFVNGAIAIAACFKQQVVAEGIETQQQHAFLSSTLCAEGQGYLFSGAVEAEEFTSLLEKRTLPPARRDRFGARLPADGLIARAQCDGVSDGLPEHAAPS